MQHLFPNTTEQPLSFQLALSSERSPSCFPGLESPCFSFVSSQRRSLPLGPGKRRQSGANVLGVRTLGQPRSAIRDLTHTKSRDDFIAIKGASIEKTGQRSTSPALSSASQHSTAQHRRRDWSSGGLTDGHLGTVAGPACSGLIAPEMPLPHWTNPQSHPWGSRRIALCSPIITSSPQKPCMTRPASLALRASSSDYKLIARGRERYKRDMHA